MSTGDYDPFMVFGPGSKKLVKTCKHRGRWRNLCKCNSVVEGGIGRIFVNNRQVYAMYIQMVRGMEHYAPIFPYEIFKDQIIKGLRTWRGIKIEYRP